MADQPTNEIEATQQLCAAAEMALEEAQAATAEKVREQDAAQQRIAEAQAEIELLSAQIRRTPVTDADAFARLAQARTTVRARVEALQEAASVAAQELEIAQAAEAEPMRMLTRARVKHLDARAKALDAEMLDHATGSRAWLSTKRAELTQLLQEANEITQTHGNARGTIWGLVGPWDTVHEGAAKVFEFIAARKRAEEQGQPGHVEVNPYKPPRDGKGNFDAIRVEQ